jgi:hypothetical protein
MSAPFATVRGGAGEPPDDRLAFADQLDLLHLDIREGLAKRRDPGPRATRGAFGRQLRRPIQLATVDGRVDPLPDYALPILDGHQRSRA